MMENLDEVWKLVQVVQAIPHLSHNNSFHNIGAAAINRLHEINAEFGSSQVIQPGQSVPPAQGPVGTEAPEPNPPAATPVVPPEGGDVPHSPAAVPTVPPPGEPVGQEPAASPPQEPTPETPTIRR